MNKAVIMLELGWTSKQYEQENTSEDLARIMVVMEKRHTVATKYPKPPPAPQSSPRSVKRRFH